MIIGIIGGGQLGMMMAEAAKKYHHTIIGLDPNKNCPLSTIADDIIVSDYNNPEALSKLAEKCDVITYEFENVDLDLVNKYKDMIPQKSDALYFSRNRLIEKNFAKELEIPTPKFIKFNKDDVFVPSIIKTTTGGYDGKGQYNISDIRDVDQVMNVDGIEYIIEEFIQFDYEISVVVTRDSFGNKAYYPVPINSHRNGILFTSEVYGNIDRLILSKAKEYTSRIVDKLDYVGTLAVEFFVRNNEVIFNEFAPRPHNSGHYTIEGCNVSQFENHILAITGNKVISPTLVNPTVMINVLGQDSAFVERISGSNMYHHDYFKSESRTNRKMGHITIVSNTIEEVIMTKNNIIKE